MTPRLAGRGDEPRSDESCEHPKPRLDLGGGDFDVGRLSASRAFLEGLPRRAGCPQRRLAPMHHGGRFGGENLLRLVDLGAAQRFEPGDFIERQFGEEL